MDPRERELIDESRVTPLGIELDGQELRFYRAVAEKDTAIGGWYLGARMALRAVGNPERLAHAGHSLRELMDKLNRVLDVPVKADGNSLGNKFRAMTDSWDKSKRLSECFADGTWSGVIDDHARRGFAAVDDAIEWQRTNQATRKEQHRETLRALDATGIVLAPSIEAAFVEQWASLRNYFVKVCHHDWATTEDEFLGHLDNLERLLLDRVKPRTFDEMASIDKLIAEASSGT